MVENPEGNLDKYISFNDKMIPRQNRILLLHTFIAKVLFVRERKVSFTNSFFRNNDKIMQYEPVF